MVVYSERGAERNGGDTRWNARSVNAVIVTSPAEAVAKYCVEHVSVCVCVCLFVRDHISGATRAIFTKFSTHVAYGPGSVVLWQDDEIPRERGSFGGFLLHWQCIGTA